MSNKNSYSILFPYYEDTEYKQLSPTAFHDLGLDNLCNKITTDAKERRYITDILSNMTHDSRVAEFRHEVFADILKLPDLRNRIMELLDRIDSVRSFTAVQKSSDEKVGVWHLFHRLDELSDYIECVEALKECLDNDEIKSQGLKGLKQYIDSLYEQAYYKEMKKDIQELKINASQVKSVTIGINVNERFEAVSMGLISVNDKPFKKSGIVSNFADALLSGDRIQKGTQWNGSMHYQLSDSAYSAQERSFAERVGRVSAATKPFMDSRVRETLLSPPDGDGTASATFHLEKVLNKMLDNMVKRLSETLKKYSNIAILNIAGLIPEFVYYTRFAEFLSELQNSGCLFCKPHILKEGSLEMEAKDLYNLKLAINVEDKKEIVYNDLNFDNEHTVYILTGANRGGKTTITQAVGLMFALAQGGIYVPASSFGYKPVDCIYTHFPADEDKTMDLGRLGEECVRFKEMYSQASENSLMLLNETFSTTSFEEGYYIAKDSVKAILNKQIRTIYNTHMHKLAMDIDEINKDSKEGKASSLIMKSDEGKRSFKVEIAMPEGMSYARDIAKKYGVTYDMLIADK